MHTRGGGAALKSTGLKHPAEWEENQKQRGERRKRCFHRICVLCKGRRTSAVKTPA